MNDYDVVIIGGGPSGLYTAQQIHKKMKDKKILILEKNGYLGGRTRMDMFCGQSVVTGAGVGRLDKDILLKKSYGGKPEKKSWKSRICLLPSSHKKPSPSFMKKVLKRLKDEYVKDPSVRSHTPFKTFFLQHLSPDEYDIFCWYNGYTDFENADIQDTLWNYGFEDNFPGSAFFRIDWNGWIEKLFQSLNPKNVHVLLNRKVNRWIPGEERFTITTSEGEKYYGKILVIAGTMSVVKDKYIKEAIGYNAFLRMYVYSPDIIKKSDECSVWYRKDDFKKTIHLSEHIMMLSYSDNEHAIRTNRMKSEYIRNTQNPKITKIRKYFWRHGTHYYQPLNTQKWTSRDEFLEYAQHPLPHLFIVGEMISNNQGWTEGALESVHRILPKLMDELKQTKLIKRERK